MSSLIAIAGVSRSGKSTLASWLAKQLPQSITLHQDDYVKAPSDLPLIDELPNWEHPDSIDWKAWEEAIQTARKQYENVLIEGILVFAEAKINTLINRAIYLEIDQVTFTERRLDEKRWGEETSTYIQHVWEAHTQYGTPSQDLNVIRVNNVTPEKYSMLLALITSKT